MRNSGLRAGCLAALACLFTVASAEERETEQLPEDSEKTMRYIEELFVEGERIHGDDMDLTEMERVYAWKDTAARNFKTGQYEKAFPQLLLLARMGFKDSQARVAYIYLHGLGGQEKSNMEALGWLGVASEGETRPAYRNLFKQMMAQVPEPQLVAVNNHVQTYRDKYGADEMGIYCDRSRTGHISKFLCRYDAEWDRHQIRLMMLAAGGVLPW